MYENTTEFVVKPNNASRPYAWVWLFVLLVFIAIGIALRFAWLGYWMILPFAVIDMVAVGFVLYMVTRSSSYVEKITISAEEVKVEHLERNRDRDWTFPLHWARVQMERPRHRWYPHRLLIGTRGKWVEIGQCLTHEERVSLAEAIEEEIVRRDNAAPEAVS